MNFHPMSSEDLILEVSNDQKLMLDRCCDMEKSVPFLATDGFCSIDSLSYVSEETIKDSETDILCLGKCNLIIAWHEAN